MSAAPRTATAEADPSIAADEAAPACLVCGASLEGAEVRETPDHKGIAPGRFRVLTCPRCGGGTTLPLVPPEALAGYYESEDYGPHLSGGGMSPLFRLAMATRVRTARLFAPLRRAQPGRLLDVGCGRGDLGAVLMGRGWTVSGLDPSPRACEAARSRGVEAEMGTIETVELPEAAYDAIVFHHALEHFTDPVGALRTARAALRPGGLLLIGVPNFASRRSRRYRERWWLNELPRHRFHFTPDALHRALEEAGLEVRELRESAAVLGTIASLQQRSTGGFLESGPAFLAGYALTLAAFPLAWGSNAVRGGGELLNAVAIRPG
jgi:SAM-dependent methyltransferase